MGNVGYLLSSTFYSILVFTHPSTGLVVVQVHHVPDLPGLPHLLLVRRVDEALGELDAVAEVVAAAAPVPALGRGPAPPRHLAAALGQVATAAGPRHRVHHPGAGDRVQERRLLRTCQESGLT